MAWRRLHETNWYKLENIEETTRHPNLALKGVDITDGWRQKRDEEVDR